MVFLFLLLSIFQPSAQDDATRKEMSALQGTWFAVALQDEDRKAPPAVIKQFKLVIKDQKMIFSAEGSPTSHSLGFRIDPQQNPHAIDIEAVILGGPSEGKTLPGIYKLEGDQLTICLPTKPDVKDRPKSFECKKGSGLRLFVVKKKVN